MPVKPCLHTFPDGTRCGALSPESYCPQHRGPAGGFSPKAYTRDNTAHVRWARAVKRRDGHQCRRCGRLDELQAHHLRPGYDLEAGITLCRYCHRRVDSHAR